MAYQDPRNSAPTAQTGEPLGEVTDDGVDWLKRAKSAYFTSTSYVDTNLRKSWDDSIRAFNNQHPTDSKYNAAIYEKRSRLYRPKARTIIRKNEAAACAAFFSNSDATSINPVDQTNKAEKAGADVMKQLLQYRLTTSIPWYHIVLGGLQDAQTVGAVIAHVYWDYKAAPKRATPASDTASSAKDEVSPDGEYPEQSSLPRGAFAFVEQGTVAPRAQASKAQQPKQAKPMSDKPVVKLLRIENIRIDPGADWTDPINSSPYVVEMMPMYVMDVKAKMVSGEWVEYSDSEIKASMDTRFDSTSIERAKGQENPYLSAQTDISDYQIVWVQRHIHRLNDTDMTFYTLGVYGLLTDPEPLNKHVLHGKRPYVMGCCVLETHKPYSTSIPDLGKGLIDESNEVVNQRIDNVKFVLNKKFLVKRGQEADIQGLVRNVPGGVVLLNNPETDVKELSWPDVTASSYEEQSRIDNDMYELLGNFSPAQVMADHGVNGPARNMAILSQSTGTLVEYLLKTYAETFVQPVLRQLVALEQAYETDQTVLSVAAKKAELFQKYGVDEVTDELLEQELTLTVNVGMGATDPQLKLQKFIVGMQAYGDMIKNQIPGIDMQQVGNEIFGLMGYADGSRFFSSDNPQVVQLQQQLQQAQGVISQLQAKVQAKSETNMVKLTTSREANHTKVLTTQIQEENENIRNVTTHLRAIREGDAQRQHDQRQSHIERMHAARISKENHVRIPNNMKGR